MVGNGWLDLSDEETPSEFPMAETNFEFIASPYYVTCILGNNVLEIELSIPSPVEPIDLMDLIFNGNNSFSSTSYVIFYSVEELD